MNKNNLLKTIIYLFIIILIIILFIFKLKNNNIDIIYTQIHGNSMYPTLLNGKLYKIQKVNGINELKRNDIVLFKISGNNTIYIKRLKILPKDKFIINYENSGEILILTINNKFNLKFKDYKNTKFFKTLILWSQNTKKGWIKAPQCGVFGDNFNNSIDSLDFGFIGCDKITHKIVK